MSRNFGGSQTYCELYGEDKKLIQVYIEMPYVSEVAEGSAAETADVGANDVIVAYGDWDYLNYTGYREVQLTDLNTDIVKSKRGSKKPLINCP